MKRGLRALDDDNGPADTFNVSDTERLRLEKRRKRRENAARSYREANEAVRIFDAHVAAGNSEHIECERRAVMRKDQLRAICDLEEFEPVSNKRKEEIFRSASSKLDISSFERKICGVCDCAWPTKFLLRKRPKGRIASRWVARLRPS